MTQLPVIRSASEPGWIWVPLFATAVVGVLFLVRAIATARKWNPETARKAVHVLLGLGTLSFPWLFGSPWPVLVLASLLIGLFIWMRIGQERRSSGLGAALHGVQRKSFGEIWFVLAILVLFLCFRHQPLHFVVPVLVLVFADAAGALFGKRYGQAEYNTLEGRKSAEGSACVFLAAYFSVHLPLAFLAPEIGKPEAILLALCVAILVMIVEGFSGYGLDNFIAPVFSGFLLYRLHDRAAPEMAAMVAVLAGLLMIGTCFRKRGTLDGGAILGGVLLAFSGYAVFSWVGLLIVLGPYLNHLFAAAPFLKELGPVHDLRSVLGVAITAAFWLILGLFFDEILPWLIPFAVGFAVHLGLLNRITQRATSPHGRSLVRVLRAALKGTVICLLPLLFVEQIRPLLLGIVPATFILTLLAGAWMEIFVRAERDENPVPWIAHALLGTIASSLTLFLVFGDELIAYFNFK